MGFSTAQAPCVSSAQSSRRFETKAEQSELAELLRWDRAVPTGDIDVTVYIYIYIIHDIYIYTLYIYLFIYMIICVCVRVLSTDVLKF